ncbi:hypothetical protein A0128_20725 [Leptospira tipperaryensis]|uniref:Uncharacterized protein n=1 Tax=Leptospira tipperaryensis TaxID=2564040 RepID=A0A1D7V3P4_9LEPT|nr:hypothetical protein A0128_20725 [Leptospira tipperaryensis]
MRRTRTKRGPSDSYRKETPKLSSGYYFPCSKRTSGSDDFDIVRKKFLFEVILCFLTKNIFLFKEDEP